MVSRRAAILTLIGGGTSLLAACGGNGFPATDLFLNELFITDYSKVNIRNYFLSNNLRVKLV